MIVLDGGGASGLGSSSNWWGYMKDAGADSAANYQSDPVGEFENQGSYKGFMSGLGEIAVEFGDPMVDSGGVGEHDEGYEGLGAWWKKPFTAGAKLGTKGLPIVKQFGPWGKAIAGAHKAITVPATKKLAGGKKRRGDPAFESGAIQSGLTAEDAPVAGSALPSGGPGAGPGFFTPRNTTLSAVGLLLAAGLAFSVLRRRKKSSWARRYSRRRR